MFKKVVSFTLFMGERSNHVRKEVKTLEGITEEIYVVPLEDSKYIIKEDGTWFCLGAEGDLGDIPEGMVTNQRILQYFNENLGKDKEGYYILQELPIEGEKRKVQHYLQVEDTAYFVRMIELKEGNVQMLLNDNTYEKLKPETLAIEDDKLYCQVKGDHKAKFLRTPYTDFMLAYDKLIDEGMEFPNLNLNL